MKWILGVSLVALIVGVVATMTVPAQTITPDQGILKLFPAETQGIGSVDVAALRDATLFNDMVLQKLPSFPHEMAEFVDATGFQIQRDVDKVTGGYIGPDKALVIIQARYDKFKLEQFIKDKAEDIQTETYLGRVIYTGRSESDRKGGVSFIDNLILAGSLPTVKQAIDRMAAPAPSALDNAEMLAQIRSIEAGNQIWAAGKFDFNMIHPPSQTPPEFSKMASSLKAGTYQMRIDQDVRVKATGSFDTAEMAKATGDTLRGLLAMGKLQFAKEEKLTRLLEGVGIDNTGQSLTVTFNASGDLLKQLQDLRTIPKFGQ